MQSAYRALKSDGKLILWFTHRSWTAWESILYSLFLAGFKVTDFYPFVSEHPTRSVTQQGEPKLNRTIIIAAKKRFNPVYPIKKDIFNFCQKTYNYLIHAKIMPNEEIALWEKALTLMAAATARMTVFDQKEVNKEYLFYKNILPTGICLGLLSLVNIILLQTNKETLNFNELSAIDKAKLLLTLVFGFFGEVKEDFKRYISQFCKINYSQILKIEKEIPNKRFKNEEDVIESLEMIL